MEPSITPSKLDLIAGGIQPTSEELTFVERMQDMSLGTQLIILPLSIILAVLVNYILTHWLKRLAARTKTRHDDILIENITNPLYWTFIIVGIGFSLTVLQVGDDILVYSNRAVVSLLLIIWTHAVAKISEADISYLIKSRNEQNHEAETDVIPFISGVVKVTIYTIGFLMVISVWGLNIVPLITSAGILGAGIAFGAKDWVANIFGGLTIIMDRPYKVGDLIVVKDQYKGKVIEIGMRNTRIQTFDKVLITIPNSLMITDAVINETGIDPKSRFKLEIGVAYDSNLDQVEDLLYKIINKHPNVLNEPEPFIRYQTFGNSAITLKIYGYVDGTGKRGITKHELIKEIKKRFSQENIEIPFPQQDVHLDGPLSTKTD